MKVKNEPYPCSLIREMVTIQRIYESIGEIGSNHTELEPQVEIGVVCGRGRNPTLRLWPTIFSGKIDVFPGDRRSRLISSMTSVAPA